MIAYGRLDHLQDLDDRHRDRAGDLAHEEGVRDQIGILEEIQELHLDDPR